MIALMYTIAHTGDPPQTIGWLIQMYTSTPGFDSHLVTTEGVRVPRDQVPAP
jgi:hypothetical protein